MQAGAREKVTRMSTTALVDLFVENPVIASIRDPKMLDVVLQYGVQVVFLLYGNICTLQEDCDRLVKAGRTVFLHLDMVSGLQSDSCGIEFLTKYTEITGIISTKPNTIRLAQAAGFKTIQRSFLLDSAALHTSRNNAASCRPDLIEVLPGISPEIVVIGKANLGLPIVAGGFIKEKKDLFAALGAGAIAVSTSAVSLWPLEDE